MSNLKNLAQSLFKKSLHYLSAGVAVSAIMLGAGVFAESASALNIGGIEIQDTADQLLGESGVQGSNGFSTEAVLLDKATNTFAFSIVPDAFVTLGFSKSVFNLSGSDLAFFDLDEFADEFLITAIDGIDLDEAFLVTTERIQDSLGEDYLEPDLGIPVNVGYVDLTELGLASGASISNITIGFGPNAQWSTLALVGSVSRSVPEPSAMFGLLATAGLLAYQRKLKLAKK